MIVQAQDLFKQINNSVLDLQMAQSQSYERPIRTLGRLLHHDDLTEANQELVQGLDFEGFMHESEATLGGIIGSGKLVWPDDEKERLGLTLLLIWRFAENSSFMVDVGHTFFHSGSQTIAGVHAITRQLIIPFVRDYKDFVMSRGSVRPRVMTAASRKVFIVHGHDGEAREGVARFLEKIGFEAIILHEQANRGMTVIEKVNAHGDVGFAVVLLTPDDEGRVKSGGELEPRARQNVLLELGYFIGRIGRDKVCALKKGNVEIPSDFAGVVWQEMDATSGWKQALARELQAAGHQIDWNSVMR